MRALNIKLFRDLKRLWAQALAIALVIGGGLATLVLAVGSHHSLDETRAAYYERYGFGDVFAQVRRAPNAVISEIVAIPGVAAVEPRIAQLALLDIPNFREPASGQFISIPDKHEQVLNRLYMRSGRLPDSASEHEVVVNEGFAAAHGYTLGSRFSAILNGRKRELTIVGTALSPEFVYAVGPGDIMPDNRRFGIMWMPERALAGAYNLKDAFSSVVVKLLPRRLGRRGYPQPRYRSRTLWRHGRIRPKGPGLPRLAQSRAGHAQQYEPNAATNISAGRRVPREPDPGPSHCSRTRTDRTF